MLRRVNVIMVKTNKVQGKEIGPHLLWGKAPHLSSVEGTPPSSPQNVPAWLWGPQPFLAFLGAHSGPYSVGF